jgi:phosphatidylethanolamine/phosphatidyl-N-methylethanolamine N-methyltransferase
MNVKEQEPCFLREFFATPGSVGSVRPSSRYLARRMIAALDPRDETVVELGPGTGVFTDHLLKRGVSASRLVLVEFNEHFAAHLKQRFPGVRVLQGDAQHLPALLREAGETKIKRVISGLPLRNFPAVVRQNIAAAIGEGLAPGGRYVQFTYAAIPPLSPAEAAPHGLTGKRQGLEVLNVPPAFVWRYEKTGA